MQIKKGDVYTTKSGMTVQVMSRNAVMSRLRDKYLVYNCKVIDSVVGEMKAGIVLLWSEKGQFLSLKKHEKKVYQQEHDFVEKIG